MQAVVVTEFGAPDVMQLQEVDAPRIETGEVLVDVVAVDVSDLDTKLRAGAGGDWFPHEPPYIPGGGVAGRVRAVADDVDPGVVGQRVVARTVSAPIGACAEQVVARADHVAAIPDDVDDLRAAALVHDGLTAAALLNAHPVADSDRILILGAAGGAACLLVQAAAATGAVVVGAARGAHKLDAVLERGADHVVDYSSDGWVDRARDQLGGNATVVFDGVGGDRGRAALEHLTTPGAHASAHGAASGHFSVDEDRKAVADRLDISITGIEIPQAALERFVPLMDQALTAAATGRLQPIVGRTAALADAADLHRARERREVVGSTLLRTRD